MQIEKAYKQIWEYLLRRIDEEARKTNRRQVSLRLKVGSSTIKRWLDGESGTQAVSLEHLLKIVFLLPVPIKDLLGAISMPEGLRGFFLLVDSHPELIKKLAKILEGCDESAIKHLEATIDLILPK